MLQIQQSLYWKLHQKRKFIPRGKCRYSEIAEHNLLKIFSSFPSMILKSSLSKINKKNVLPILTPFLYQSNRRMRKKWVKTTELDWCKRFLIKYVTNHAWIEDWFLNNMKTFSQILTEIDQARCDIHYDPSLVLLLFGMNLIVLSIIIVSCLLICAHRVKHIFFLLFNMFHSYVSYREDLKEIWLKLIKTKFIDTKTTNQTFTIMQLHNNLFKITNILFENNLSENLPDLANRNFSFIYFASLWF